MLRLDPLRHPFVRIWAIRVGGEGSGPQTWENPPMRRGEGVFSFMTWSDRYGVVMFVVDIGDEAHCMLGVTRL
jgi:hypothetical protein